MATDIDAANTFVIANARLVERRVHAVLLGDGDGGVAEVVAAVAAYQNPDGGFGNALEPDKRAPGSQALDVEIAFERLVMVGADAPHLTGPACSWLETIADPAGAVPILMASAVDHPHAGHWARPAFPPGLNPTAAIAGHANTLGIGHPWVERATDYGLVELESGRVPDEGHELVAVTKLLASAPDRHRVERLAEPVRSAIPNAGFVRFDPESDAYGVTPLDFAPSPDAMARSWFPDELIDGHLDALEAEQQADGGWPIAWEPPSPAASAEWRGIRTLVALRTLLAYGRI